MWKKKVTFFLWRQVSPFFSYLWWVNWDSLARISEIPTTCTSWRFFSACEGSPSYLSGSKLKDEAWESHFFFVMRFARGRGGCVPPPQEESFLLQEAMGQGRHKTAFRSCVPQGVQPGVTSPFWTCLKTATQLAAWHRSEIYFCALHRTGHITGN